MSWLPWRQRAAAAACMRQQSAGESDEQTQHTITPQSNLSPSDNKREDSTDKFIAKSPHSNTDKSQTHGRDNYTIYPPC